MEKNRVSSVSFLVVFVMLLGLLGGATAAAQEPDPDKGAIVTVTVTADEVIWRPQIEGAGFALTISGPGGFYLQQAYQPGDGLVFRAKDGAGDPLPDGVYQYEFRVLPLENPVDPGDALRGLVPPTDVLAQSGGFSIRDGRFVLQNLTENADAKDAVESNAPNDQVILDDLIVDGSACIGFDCVNGENFGFDTLRLKENNLRINFYDTSTSAGFPSNDWTLIANDSASGGSNYFSIYDASNARNVFVVEAGAPSNSLYVDDYGRVGLGTSTPAVEMHVADGDTPTVRLDQDGSGGWAPQRWDVAGNEANLFIRDVTNGSTLPFRIQPGAPSSALTIKSGGNVGVGTWSPSANLHVYGNDGATQLLVEEASSTTALRTGIHVKNNGPVAVRLENTASGVRWLFGANTGDTFAIAKLGAGVKFELDGNGNLEIGGTLTENSNVHFKENFVVVNPRDVLAAVAELPITSWNFKFDDPSLRHLGPMAQDFYRAFGLGADEEHIAPIDTNGVALAAIQGLNEIVEEKDAQIEALQAQNAELEARLTALEQAVRPAPRTSFWTILPWLLSGVLLLLIVAGALGMRLYNATKSG